MCITMVGSLDKGRGVWGDGLMFNYGVLTVDVEVLCDTLSNAEKRLDFILALEEYLELYNTSLAQLIEWKEHEDMQQMQEA